MFLAQKNGFVALFGNLLRVLVTHAMTFIMISGLVWSSSVYSQNTVESDAAIQKNILIVGDSLSAAYKLANNEGWPHLLQNELLEKGIDYRVVNASVSGATTAAGLQVMPKALREYQPQIVIIELGGNDGLQGKPVPYIIPI